MVVAVAFVLSGAGAGWACGPPGECADDGACKDSVPLKGKYWALTFVYFAKHKLAAKQAAMADDRHTQTVLAQLKDTQKSIVDGAYDRAVSNITHQVLVEINQNMPDKDNQAALAVLFDATLKCLDKVEEPISKPDMQAIVRGAATARGVAGTNSLYAGLTNLIEE